MLAAELGAVSEESDARVEGDRAELRDPDAVDPELDRGRDLLSHPHRDTPEREG